MDDKPPKTSKKKEAKIEGYLIKNDDRIAVKTDFGTMLGGPATGEMWDIDFAEVIEEFDDGEPVRIKVRQANIGKAIYDQKSWNADTFNELHPDYTHASESAHEKFLDMKFGMMIHWGFYAQLGIPESWPANATRCDPEFLDVYYTLWQVFNPVQFDADEWAELAQRAGMQFFQFTTKHHDGFCMYDTKTKTWARKRISNQGPGIGGVEDVYIHYSIMDTKFKHDIVGELVNAFRKRDMGIGFYFSHIDWNDPNFRWDKANRSFDPSYNPDDYPQQWQAFIDREKAQLREIFTNYGEIDQIFFDGTWFGLAKDSMIDIVLMCRELQPNCMFSDRGLGPYGDFTSPERWIPHGPDDERLRGRKYWQVCDPIHGSWAWLPEDKYKTKERLLRNFIDAISKGGTYVFAISPMQTGRFPAKTVEILEFMGDWLEKYGEAIYETRTWKKPKEENAEIYYTASKDGNNLYLIHIGQPGGKIEVHGIVPFPESDMKLLDTEHKLEWSEKNAKLSIQVPKEIMESKSQEIAFVLKIRIN